MRFSWMNLLLAGVAVPCVAGSALAQNALTTQHDIVVVTATRLPESLETLPASVTVLSARQLQQQGDVSLADGLSAVPGVNLVQSGSMGQPASLFMRGNDSDHVLVLRDGVPVNDSASPAGAFDFGLDLLNDVSRIEIVRGPLSGLYGSGAIGGVVNMITPQGKGALGGDISVMGGAPATLFGAGDIHGSQGGFDYAAGVESGSTKGFDVTPQRMSYYANHPEGARFDTGYANLGYSPDATTRFGLIVRGREAVAGYNDEGFDTSTAAARSNDLFTRASVDSSLFNNVWQTGLAASLVRDDRHYVNLLNPNDPNMDMENSTYRGIDQRLQWNNKIIAGIDGISTGGFDFGFEHANQSAAVVSNTSSIYGLYSDQVTAHRNSDAGYVGLVQSVDRITISANGRAEHVGAVPTDVTWRAGASVALPEIASNLRVAYGTGFKAPSLYDLFGLDSYGYTGNPHLQPERSDSAEVGLRTELLDKRISWDVAIFQQHIRNLITYVYAPVDTTENIGKSRIDGIEANITLRPAPFADVVISATHIDPRDLSDDVLLTRRARNKVSVLAHVTWQQLTVVPEFDYTGASYDYLYANNGNYNGEGFGQSGMVANLSAQYQWQPRVQFTVTVRNLFDSRYEPANGYQMAGRMVLVGTKVGF